MNNLDQSLSRTGEESFPSNSIDSKDMQAQNIEDMEKYASVPKFSEFDARNMATEQEANTARSTNEFTEPLTYYDEN